MLPEVDVQTRINGRYSPQCRSICRINVPLAAQFELHELKERSKMAIRSYLTAENIVHELFSDFTWR